MTAYVYILSYVIAGRLLNRFVYSGIYDILIDNTIVRYTAMNSKLVHVITIEL